MARIIGKDALPARQQLTLLCGELLGDAFLRQSAFSPVDRVCSPQRQSAMMRLLGKFFDLAEAAVGSGLSVQQLGQLGCVRPLQRMGEEIGDDALDRLAELEVRIDREFAALAAPAAAGSADRAEVPDATDR
jgi:V/A-type H+-transporting ATPase subunit A